MVYDKLKYFSPILKRDDFSYIADTEKIKQITDIMLRIPKPDNKEQEYIALLNKYLQNLVSFYKWINTEQIPAIKKGCSFCEGELLRGIALLKEPSFKRTSIKEHHIKRFNKLFLYGLNRLNNGVRTAFAPDIITTTNITTEQIRRYVLDDNIGIGRGFLFNKKGQYAFVNKLSELNKQELNTAVKLILKQHHTRNYGDWMDLGLSRDNIRILLIHRALKKDILMFLYKVGEHADYERQLNILREQKFKAA